MEANDEHSQDSVDDVQRDADERIDELADEGRDMEERLDQAFDQAEQQIPGTQTFNYTVTGPPKQVRRVTRCIERASTAAQIQRCLP